mgnify:CR=1 FL=1
MRKFFQTIVFWLCSARAYTIPISVLNWIVIFIYSLKFGGNAVWGIIALFGVVLVHLATNLIDDYFDYKILIKDEKYINSAQNCKCKYLKDNLATTKDLLTAIIIFLGLAGIIGIFLFFVSGIYVGVIAFLALIFAICYQRFSLKGLGELIIIIMYGPLLYEGIFYVMTGMLSWKVILLSLACAMLTNSILYTHMLMDFDGDEVSHKITLSIKFKTKERALKFLSLFYILTYLIIFCFAFVSRNYYCFLTLFVLPLIFDLYNSLYLFNKDKTNVPKIRLWHYPLDNWNKIKHTKDAPFYFRFFYSRNILVLFMFLLSLALILQN